MEPIPTSSALILKESFIDRSVTSFEPNQQRTPQESGLRAESYILRVPDEILDDVVRLAGKHRRHSNSPSFSAWDYSGLHSMALVCRRFNNITTPILYQDLSCGCSLKKRYPPYYSCPDALGPHDKKLHRTLLSNSGLRHFCRTLTIGLRFMGYDRGARQLAGELVTMLPHTTALHIHEVRNLPFRPAHQLRNLPFRDNGIPAETMEARQSLLRTAIANMPNLKIIQGYDMYNLEFIESQLVGA
jgi:hypothetical protein